MYFDLSRIDIFNLVDTNVFDSVYVNFKFKNSNVFPSDFHTLYKKINKNYSKSFSFSSNIKGFGNDLFVEKTILSNKNNLIEV